MIRQGAVQFVQYSTQIRGFEVRSSRSSHRCSLFKGGTDGDNSKVTVATTLTTKGNVNVQTGGDRSSIMFLPIIIMLRCYYRS